MHNKLNGQISPKNSSDLVNVQSGVHPIPLNLSCFVLCLCREDMCLSLPQIASIKSKIYRNNVIDELYVGKLDTSDENCYIRAKYYIVLLTPCITDFLGWKQTVNKVIRPIIFTDLSPLCQPYLEYAECIWNCWVLRKV